ncbi:response regulator [Clostridium sp. BL-8]|uniref:response regulator transcription factor n=1 Tax=Clostridium sp. BL-8 TaxID=349938 RepID=UPI00098BEE3A|nr:response regulator [Clostridium sp. BL-8]OOM80117.1 putative response regulatory protein [Clostridium sp. BL-8]
MRILIVEDEINAREGLGNLLEKINDNYIVCGKASDGEQGLIFAKEYKPDLIFTDIEMPKLNGLDMLERIKENGQDPYVIILSGYSDFKYAQKGIKLGVEEYLLKPITYSDLRISMEQIERKLSLKREELLLFGNHIPKEKILEQILLNKGANLKDLYKVIEENIKQYEELYLVNLRLRNGDEKRSEIIVQEIYNFIKNYKLENFYYSIMKEYNYVTMFVSARAKFMEFTKMLKYNLLFSLRKNGFSDITISFINLNSLEEIENSFSKLKGLSKWPIVLGNDEIICEEMIFKLKINHCNYPIRIDNEVLKAIRNNDRVKLIDINKNFVSYLKADIYDPDQVIDICSKYIFSILTVSKSFNNDMYIECGNEGILDAIKDSCTFDELKEQLDRVIDKVCKRNHEGTTVNSLIVRKAMNYIKEYYNDKVSLEEIADGMNITPEYLSRLFTKELGKSFSDYLKEFRIDKAKELLTGKKMKIYEVAQQVGYSDSKYFCKVFKELTGMAPKEYMKFY